MAVGLTLFIPRLIKNTNMTMLVLSGIIVKGIMDSVMGIIKYVADPETELQSITYWQLGSLTKVLPRDLFTVGPVIIAASVIIFLLRWRINILSLGDREAKTRFSYSCSKFYYNLCDITDCICSMYQWNDWMDRTCDSTFCTNAHRSG